jgi:Fur family ferric uptake transcriptional regulator
MKNNFVEKAEQLFKKCKVKFTDQRRIIAKVISESQDHPDVEQVFERSTKFDKTLNLATVYRTINLFEKFGILNKHYFGDNKARYEPGGDIHHDHLIDIGSGNVTEFSNNEIRKIIVNILDIMGYEIVSYNLEVYGVKKDSRRDDDEQLGE